MAMSRRPTGDRPEKPVPQNVEAEEALLGSILLDAGVIDRVAPLVAPEDFYRERNGLIFGACLDLVERGEPVDYITLIGELERTDRIEEVGGVSYLMGLLGVVPTPIHAPNYANLIAANGLYRRLISLGGKIATMGFQASVPPEEAVERAEALLAAIVPRSATSQFVPLDDTLSAYLDELNAIRAGADISEYAIPTGLRQLDEILRGGLGKGDLIILAARPGMGKTALALQIARSAAVTYGKTPAIFSLEMSAGQLAGRLLAAEAEISEEILRKGTITPPMERRLGDAIGVLSLAPILVDDSPEGSISSIRQRVRRLSKQRQIDLVIVDHIQLVKVAGNNGQNRTQELGEISRQLKAMAREMNIPVLVLSQLNRELEKRSDKRPSLSDLRESGALEQDADVVLSLYRPDYYNKSGEPDSGLTEIAVLKQRGGQTGRTDVVFSSWITRFFDTDSLGR